MISAFQHEVSDHLSDTEIENRLEGKTFDKMLASDVSLTGRGVALSAMAQAIFASILEQVPCRCHEMV